MPSAEVRSRLRELADAQQGVVHRRQARRAGMSSAAIGRLTSSGRWQTILPAVYAVHDRPVDDLARIWAAVLYVQNDAHSAAASGATALWLAGAVETCPAVLEVTTTLDRVVRRRPGLRVRRRAVVSAHPSLVPPRQRLEDALLDWLDTTDRPERVVDLVLRVGQRRLTTPDRLRAAVDARRRVRWRALVRALCEDVGSGVHSVLERRYRQHVERAHGLPRGERNRPEASGHTSVYRDVRYRAWRVLVELDGRGAHPVEEAFRDRRRDNRAARAGEVSLRYGWRDVVADPCGVAAEVGDVLAREGWDGRPQPCGPGCRLALSEAVRSFSLNENERTA